jgi:purine nucleosidase
VGHYRIIIDGNPHRRVVKGDSSLTAQDRIKVLLDTDIGSDIDDAVCLAYLLSQPRCDLLGITTVSGEPQRRAMLADALCRAFGREGIPIHSGAANPLLGVQRQPKAQQAAVLDRWEHRRDFPADTAVDFLRETIRKYPGEITLLTIGPLTNIAALFAVDPEIPKLLKSLVMMIGTFGYKKLNTFVEWNAYLDPTAAAMVYQNPHISSVSVGLDVTTQCTFSAVESRLRFQGGALDLIADAAEVWFKQSELLTFHDPLAAVSIFRPEVMEYETGTVAVELQSSTLAGMTNFGEDPCGRHKVAARVTPDAFFREYFAVVSGKAQS